MPCASPRTWPATSKNPFEIIADYRYLLAGNLKRVMDSLAAEGMYVLREERNGKYTYHLAFRDVVFRTGSWTDVKAGIRKIWEEGKDALGRYLNRLYFAKTGTGGGFKYLTEVVSTKMVAQEQPMSCAAACIRQLLKDNGIIVSEEVVRKAAKTDGFGDGTILGNIGSALEGLLKGKLVQQGSAEITGLDDYGKVAEIISGAGSNSWIATLKPPYGPRHSVLVGDIENGIVRIRDPWNPTSGFGVGNGAEATMRLEDFVDLWRGSRHHMVRIKDSK